MKTLYWVGKNAPKYMSEFKSYIDPAVMQEVISDPCVFHPSEDDVVFVFSTVTDCNCESMIQQLTSAKVVLFIDEEALINNRLKNGKQILALLNIGFTPFSSERFIQACTSNELVSYSFADFDYEFLERPYPLSFDTCIEQINGWFSHRNLYVDNFYEIKNIRQIPYTGNSNEQPYQSVAGSLEQYFVEILFPDNEHKKDYQQYSVALLQQLGANRTISTSNQIKPFRTYRATIRGLENVLLYTCFATVTSANTVSQFYILLRSKNDAVQ